MLYGLLVAIHILAALLLILVILMQAAKGGGLSGAFGTSMGSSPLFGAATPTVLTRTTTVLAIIFSLTCISIAGIQSKKASAIRKEAKQPRKEAAVQPSEKDEVSTTAAEGSTATEKKEESLSPVEAPGAEKPKTGTETGQTTTTELKPPTAEEPPTVTPEKPEAVAPPETEPKDKESQPPSAPKPESLSPVEGNSAGENK